MDINEATELWAGIWAEGWECQDCKYCKHVEERHPYGDGYASELLREDCQAEKDPFLCPAVRRLGNVG